MFYKNWNEALNAWRKGAEIWKVTATGDREYFMDGKEVVRFAEMLDSYGEYKSVDLLAENGWVK